MNLLLLSVLAAVASVRAGCLTDKDHEQWELYKAKHDKKYGTEEEDAFRKEIVMNNDKRILDHNARYERGEETYTMELNKFADMTREEFSQWNGLRVPQEDRRDGELYFPDPSLVLSDSFDWRDLGAVTPVKNQHHCGSCWAFSTIGSLEGVWYLKTKKLVSLSEQNLVDCDKEKNQGCVDGWPNYAFEYIVKNKGIDTEQSYPYEGKDMQCRYKVSGKGAEITGYVRVENGSEDALQKALVSQGPISVCIDATDDFTAYKNGVLTDKACSNIHSELNHAVVLVGYGTQDGQDYWLIKNSWGPRWGMNGYIMMARNKNNMCGIATDASYPKV